MTPLYTKQSCADTTDTEHARRMASPKSRRGIGAGTLHVAAGGCLRARREHGTVSSTVGGVSAVPRFAQTARLLRRSEIAAKAQR